MKSVLHRDLPMLAGGVDAWWKLPLTPGCIDNRYYRFYRLGER